MLDFVAYQAAMRRNYYTQDPVLQDALTQTLDAPWRAWVEDRLLAVGERAATVWADLAVTANENPPRLRSHNPWGERIDRVEVHPSYDQLAREAYEAGVVWPRFNPVLEGRQAPWTVVFAIGYLLSQAEQGLFCPVCLTAGTAWLLERFADPSLKERFLPRVASSDYDTLWEGAMFLTERSGGSDVGANTTEARQVDGTWKLYGDKWFASNGGRAEAMMVMARPEGAPQGTRGLGLFLVPLTLPDGTRNGVFFPRTKDKLGTRSMPSVELRFEGAVAYPVGDLSRGFAQMAEMLNLSRLYNTVASIGNMRRTIATATAYLSARTAFGQVVAHAPMVRAQLIDLTVRQEAGLRLTFEALGMLDRQEAGTASERELKVLRLLTPLLKYHTAREAVDTASAAAELLGGNGYIEDWPIARFLRDAQVLPIWEGTTNILVLDVLRSFAKEGTGPAFLAWLGERLGRIHAPALGGFRDRLAREVADLEQHLLALAQLDEAARSVHAKGWCDRAVVAAEAVLLLEAAVRDAAADRGRGALVLANYVRRCLAEATWREELAGPAPQLGYEAIVEHKSLSLDEAIIQLRAVAPAHS